MESALRLALGFIRFLAGVTWLGAFVFAGYRVHQMRTLPAVEAEVLEVETGAYTAKAYRRNAAGWQEESRSRMYVPTALVRYSHNGQTVTAKAQHDVGFSWKWLVDFETREWKPGKHIWIRLDPAKPQEPLAGLGMNPGTFLPAICLVFFGFFLIGCGWVSGRAVAFALRFAAR